MDTKWKKWLNTILITMVIAVMSVAGIYGLMECNIIASSEVGYASLDNFEDSTWYKSQIESDLITYWAKQEKYGQGYVYDTEISEKHIEEIFRESRLTANLVIKPYGQKKEKVHSSYGNGTIKEGNPGGETIRLKISRDRDKSMDAQGRFTEWQNQQVIDAGEFYNFSGEPYLPSIIRDGMLINDEQGWRLESADITLQMSGQALQKMESFYNQAQNTLTAALKNFVIIGAIEIFGVILLIVLFALQKRRTRFFRWMDKIWWEVIGMAAFGLILGIVGLFYAVWAFTRQYAENNAGGTEVEIAMILCSIAMPVVIALFAVCIQTTVWRIREKNLLDSTLCLGYVRKWYRREKERRNMEYEAMSFSEQHVQDRIKLYRTIRGVLVLFILCCVIAISVIGIIGVIFAVIGVFMMRRLSEYSDKYAREQLDLSKLVDQIQRISDGELSAQTDLPKDSPYYEYSTKLANIGSGMEKALETQMKGERMKIDLITNVSHDLKTPLTSIIGYVDLLSRDPGLSQEAKDYVKILNQKTERLKHIIADLFELAKATSGDAKVDLEPMDMKRLIEQTLGDMEDQIKDFGFKIKFQCDSEHTRFLGDVNRMYRVVQNVIENALKYSLSGTRIFVRIKDEASKVTLEVINTASYEMDFTEEEIMERFARAEKSRTSEGNGLGLSIADSFTKNCGGTFNIKISGDQFKVTVQFPQYLE